MNRVLWLQSPTEHKSVFDKKIYWTHKIHDSDTNIFVQPSDVRNNLLRLLHRKWYSEHFTNKEITYENFPNIYGT